MPPEEYDRDVILASLLEQAGRVDEARSLYFARLPRPMGAEPWQSS
ncbi:hypothetical protein ACWFOB_23205 [Bacillus subtilis]